MPELKLTNMKIDAKARDAKYKESSVAVDAPIYPWGLSISLDEDALDALGITKLPEVGKPMMLVARVDVTSVSENKHTTEGNGTEKHRSVSLQITDLAIGPNDESSTPDAQDVLYDSKG